jgi:hypothetical protein
VEIKLSACEASRLYQYLEDSDIRYWENPMLARVQSELSGWYRQGGGLADCDCEDEETRHRVHGLPFVVDAVSLREVRGE